MSRVQEEIEMASEAIESAERYLNFLVARAEVLEDPPFKITWGGKDSRLVIRKLEDLHAARAFMKELYGSWKDTFGTIFYSQGRSIATWSDPNHDWSIWLVCPIDEFPKELMPSDSCHWVESASKDYALVCNHG